MTVYVDKNYRCHAENADGRQAIDDEFFAGRAPAVIEGYLCVIDEHNEGMIAPWRPLSELDAIQREYEQNHLLTQYEAALSSIEQALEVQT